MSKEKGYQPQPVQPLTPDGENIQDPNKRKTVEYTLPTQEIVKTTQRAVPLLDILTLTYGSSKMFSRDELAQRIPDEDGKPIAIALLNTVIHEVILALESSRLEVKTKKTSPGYKDIKFFLQNRKKIK